MVSRTLGILTLLLATSTSVNSPFLQMQNAPARPKSFVFPGGVKVEVKTDEMTDEEVCSVFTPVRAIQAAVYGANNVVLWTSEFYVVSPEPPPLLRIGNDKPIELSVRQHAHMIAVPSQHTTRVLEALYSRKRIRVRFFDRQNKDPQTVELETGDFAAGYERARTLCAWPPLQAERGVMPKEPDVSRDQEGHVTASVGSALYGWRMSYLPEFEYCEVRGPFAKSVFNANKGRRESDSELGIVKVFGPNGELIDRFEHHGFAPVPTRRLIEAAEKAGDYGTIRVDGEDYSVFGLPEIVAFAERICGLKIR